MALLTAVTVVAVGVEQGIVLAIAASLVEHLRRSYRPVTAVLSDEDVTGHWHAVPVTPSARTRPGVVVYRWAGSLYYANASHFLDEIRGFVPVRAGIPRSGGCASTPRPSPTSTTRVSSRSARPGTCWPPIRSGWPWSSPCIPSDASSSTTA